MDGQYKNTDREIWRETLDDFYSPSMHVTASGSIGINVGGHVIVMPVREWHKLAAWPGDQSNVELEKFLQREPAVSSTLFFGVF